VGPKKKDVTEGLAPIIDTPRRRRTEATQPTHPTREENNEERDNRRKKPTRSIDETTEADTEAITIKFDGATRNNGRTDARSSCGVYVRSYDHTQTKAVLLPTVNTNNGAEICGCTEAVKAAISIFRIDHRQRNFRIKGDSSHVVAMILSGQLSQFKKYGRMPNNLIWLELQSAIKEAYDLGIHLAFQWTPRRNNREADELANAILDGRPPNTTVVSMPTTADLTDQQLLDTIKLMTRVKMPTLRTLPLHLSKLYAQFTYSICKGGTTRARLLFILAPALLSIYTPKLDSRHTFKRLQSQF
jgi:ribonuclease HI